MEEFKFFEIINPINRFKLAKNIIIVGRPNVGKSTLFNRLVGKNLAIVSNETGVTRDIREFTISINKKKFLLFDTAGIDTLAKNNLSKDMTSNSIARAAMGDIILFVIDARNGVLGDDFEIAQTLRKQDRDVLLVLNKCENSVRSEVFSDSFSLGFGSAVQISAEHGKGISDLKDRIFDMCENLSKGVLEKDNEENFEINSEEKIFKISIAGRPNSGKSTFFNFLVDEKRSLTGPESGLTRDTVSVITQWNGERINLFDTAGMRKKNKIDSRLEKLSIDDSIRAINFSEIVIILLDNKNAFDHQDLKIAEFVGRQGRLPIFVVNKWDLESRKASTIKTLQWKLDDLLPQFLGAELTAISAKTGLGFTKLYKVIKKYYAIWEKRVSTSELNGWLLDRVSNHPPPMIKGARAKFRYVTQIKTRPPTFIFFGSRLKAIPKSYQRYLINSLRTDFNLIGVPIRIFFRENENPYRPK